MAWFDNGWGRGLVHFESSRSRSAQLLVVWSILRKRGREREGEGGRGGRGGREGGCVREGGRDGEKRL